MGGHCGPLIRGKFFGAFPEKMTKAFFAGKTYHGGEFIMKYYHGSRRRGPYFEGWYFKHQTAGGALLALIPALHVDRAGARTASLQVISEAGSWWLPYGGEALQAAQGLFQIWLDGNLMNRKGIWLDLDAEGLSLRGELRYGPFTPLGSDIMGPFRMAPGMECRHGIVSMGHRLEGALTLNGRTMDFTGGTGYIETDRGRSFPYRYLWTQCAWREARSSSLMLSVADIPLGRLSFTGCICAVLYGGREYRLATYLGARAVRWSEAGALIVQGKHRLAVELLEERGQPLRAPALGEMSRTIRESLGAAVRYRFWEGDRLLFDHTDSRAGFEYAAEERPSRHTD